MGDKTKIEWCDATWNPTSGCSHVSEGCRHCFAESIAHRFQKDFKPWTAPNAAHNVRLHAERLEIPLRWRKPRRVFVNSVSDLFHEQVPNAFIDGVFGIMLTAENHTFQVLTKRHKRMQEYLTRRSNLSGGPLPNVWLGVSAEDQKTFDERTKYLLQTPAAKRFVSLEPLLEPIILDDGAFGGGHTALTTEIDHLEDTKLDWVIVGGESGPGARPMKLEWVRSIRDQCLSVGVPFFFKQWGAWKPIRETMGSYRLERVGKKAAGNVLDGRTWEEMPA